MNILNISKSDKKRKDKMLKMKSLEQIQAEFPSASVFTLSDFSKMISIGGICRNDGTGYFHDGNKETDIDVYDNNLTWDDVQYFPYVCWYNK